MMHEFDDGLPTRKFDNFQFVEYAKVINSGSFEHRQINFAVAALQVSKILRDSVLINSKEIPEQYNTMKKLKYFG